MRLLKSHIPFLFIMLLLIGVTLSFSRISASTSIQAAPLGEPENLVTEDSFAMTLGGGYLFWTRLPGEFCSPDGTVKSFNLTTGATDILRQSCDMSPANVAADDVYVYYAEWQGDTIERIPVGGGTSTTVANATGLIFHRALTVDDTHIYFGDDDGIKRVPKEGGTVDTLAPGYDSHALAVDTDYVYWTERSPGGGGAIRRVMKSGGSVDTIVSGAGLDDPGSIAVDATHVYWTELGSGQARRIAKSGGSILDYVDADPSYQGGSIAVNDTHVYWTDTTGGSDGRLRRVVKAGGSVQNLALGLFGPGSVNLSASHVYWADFDGIWRLPLDADTVAVDLTVNDIEITQGIQNLANGVTLVADKTTFVRVYPAVDIADTPNVTAVLHGSRAGVSLPGSPLSPVLPTVYVRQIGSNRQHLSHSFNFWLPPSWRTGTVTLRAEINPGGTIPESDSDNNSLSLSRTFEAKAPVCTVMIPVRTHGSRYTVYSPGFWDIINRFETLWPVFDTWVYYQSNSLEELQVCFAGPFPYPCHGPYELPDDGWKIITSIIARDVFTDDPDVCDDANARTHYVGMVSSDTSTGSQLGYANYALAASYVKMETAATGTPFYTPRAGATLAQELAHNYNGIFGNRWQHVNCGSPDDINPNYPYPTNQIANSGDASHWGFDPISQAIIKPEDASDYLSYCSPKWSSDYSWEGIINELGSPPPARDTAAAPLGQEILIVAGVITPTNQTADFTYAYHFSQSPVTPDNLEKFRPQYDASRHVGPTYALELLDASDTVLATYPFEPTPPFESPERIFVLTENFVPGTTEVRLTAGGQEIASIQISPNAPQVHLLQPNGGEVINDELTIHWQASDADDDTLLYTVQYSPDAGATWQSIATEYPTTTLTLSDTLGLPGSTQAAIRVIATDGINTGMDSSDLPFTLQPHLPVAHISLPQNNTVFTSDQQIILAGNGHDAEDGPLTGSALTWQVDGTAVGAGQEIALTNLPPGQHTITLIATDTHNNTATDSVTILVGDERLYLPYTVSEP